MTNNQNAVSTRFTTGKTRLTYAFLWTPRSSSENDGGQDESGKKYSVSILIPKNDQNTLNKLNAAIQQAIMAGQKKGYWGDKLPVKFKLPIRDGDVEGIEKGEEYLGHWFLNAASSRRPHIVDISRNDIWEESEVYSGCYARVCLNLFAFSNNGNKGIGCRLEAVQKLADGEPLGGVPVNIDEAFGDWSDGSGDLFDTEPANGYSTAAQGMHQQQNPAYPQQQPNQAHPQNQKQGYVPQQQGYPIQQAPGYQVPQQNYPQQPQGYPQQVTSVGGFATCVAAANSILPPNIFGDEINGKVA